MILEYLITLGKKETKQEMKREKKVKSKSMNRKMMWKNK